MNGNAKFLLDTNIVLGVLNGHTIIEKFFLGKLLGKPLFISQITRLELLGYPNITPEEEAVIAEFINLVEVVSISEEVLNETIKLRRRTRLKLPDAIIVASAVINKLTLISCDVEITNTKIDNIAIINPSN